MRVKINNESFQAQKLWIRSDTEKANKVLVFEPKDFTSVENYILQNEIVNIHLGDIDFGSYSQNEIVFGKKQILFVMKEDLK